MLYGNRVDILFHGRGPSYIGNNFGDGDPGNVPNEVSEYSLPYYVPRRETFSWIYARIREANRVYSHTRQLIIELDKTDNIRFLKQVEQLLGHFGSLSIGYINGDIRESGRTIWSRPRDGNS